MLTFNEFILAEESSGSSHNTDYGAAYETATALHVHNMTGAKQNKDKEYQARIKDLKSKHEEAVSKLPEHLKQRALESAQSSAKVYVDSLEKNHGIKPSDVHEVHHTYAGIDHLVGSKVDRKQNPHDIVIKTKTNKMHGASLKATQGTLSNNSINTVDQESNKHGIPLNISKIWNDRKKKAGLENASGKEIKAVRDDEKVKKHNTAAQHEAAAHHADTFNNASVDNQRKHLKFFMKGEKPAIPYDYVNGQKGKATPNEKLEHNVAINKSSKFTAHASGGVVKIHDHEGRHIATFEHRPTHGAFSSIQVNAKIGTMKAAK